MGKDNINEQSPNELCCGSELIDATVASFCPLVAT